MDFDLNDFLDLDKFPSDIFNGSPDFPHPNTFQSAALDDPLFWSFSPPTNLPAQNSTIIRDDDSDFSPSDRRNDSEQTSSHIAADQMENESNDSWEQAKLPSIPPCLDMTSALTLVATLSERKKRPPISAFEPDRPVDQQAKRRKSESPTIVYLSEKEACALPPKALRDQLVVLYFRHLHPLCPIVDEFEFTRLYYDSLDEAEPIKRADLPLFQAMMFAAFMHVSEDQLRSTPYGSLYDGQKALCEKVKTLYRLRYTSSEFEMTKVALLLSYWSPYDSDPQVNSYWVDRAFQHARALRLWDTQCDSGALCDRRRLVWWCCLIRDRMTSFGLRRPYRLHESKSGWKPVTDKDFGLEAIFPRFVTVQSKHNTIAAFLWLCKLSEIGAAITLFQEDNRFEREWSDQLKDRTEVMRELHQVSKFDSQLKQWKKDTQKGCEEAIKVAPLGTSKMPFYVLRVLNDSFVAALYQPYIRRPVQEDPLMEKFQKVALRRAKRASLAVALQVREIVSNTSIEDIPQTIIAWLTFPTAVCLVASDMGDNTSRVSSHDYLSVLLSFFSSLESRFHSVLFLTNVIREATELIIGKKQELDVTSTHDQLRVSSPSITKVSQIPARSLESDEAEVLDVVARLLDMSLANDGESYQPADS